MNGRLLSMRRSRSCPDVMIMASPEFGEVDEPVVKGSGGPSVGTVKLFRRG